MAAVQRVLSHNFADIQDKHISSVGLFKKYRRAVSRPFAGLPQGLASERSFLACSSLESRSRVLEDRLKTTAKKVPNEDFSVDSQWQNLPHLVLKMALSGHR